MSRLWLAVVALAALAPVAEARNPRLLGDGEPSQQQQFSMGELTPTPSMWLYQQQMSQYNDPQASVRRQAQYTAWQRQQRMAARKWYGYSNSRPRANPTPFTGYYSPAWVGTVNEPFAWPGAGSAPTIIVEERSSGYPR